MTTIPSKKKDNSMNCMLEALICYHVSMDCNDWKVCCAGTSECLCLRSTYCLAVGAVPRSVGCGHDPIRGECCKCGVYCCDCALVQPRLCCGVARQTLCMHASGSLPFHKDYLNEPVCAYYFLGCLPECGCCVEPPESPALQAMWGRTGLEQGAPVMASIDRYEDDDGGTEMMKGYSDKS
eukprot:scaffold34110_cov183-Amphora_coffeaeformis.AAC.5